MRLVVSPGINWRTGTFRVWVFLSVVWMVWAAYHWGWAGVGMERALAWVFWPPALGYAALWLGRWAIRGFEFPERQTLTSAGPRRKFKMLDVSKR